MSSLTVFTIYLIIMSSFAIPIILLTIAYTYTHGQKYIGDSCDLNDKYGTCTLFRDCLPVRENLKKYKIWPKICGYQKNEPTVCCPEDRTLGELSLKKCREYSQYVYRLIRPPVPLVKTRLIKKYECGHQVVKLILGGKLARRREFPHMAAIGFEEPSGEVKWNCGGTILSESYILTAAHCLSHDQHGEARYVRVGVTNLTNPLHSQTREVEKLIPHPNYKYPKYYNDIGLIKLKRPIDLNTNARPACLYTKPNIAADKVIATGWGANTTESEHTSDELYKVTLEFVDNAKCNSVYKNLWSRKLKGIFEDIQVCADGGPDRTVMKDTCMGDSGGPLQIYHTGDDIKCMYDIVGITSFGQPCTGVAGVYVRVSHYIKWIEDTVWA